MALEGKWFFELIASDLVLLYRVKRSLYAGKTAYQEVEILETETPGQVSDSGRQRPSRQP